MDRAGIPAARSRRPKKLCACSESSAPARCRYKPGRPRGCDLRGCSRLHRDIQREAISRQHAARHIIQMHQDSSPRLTERAHHLPRRILAIHPEPVALEAQRQLMNRRVSSEPCRIDASSGYGLKHQTSSHWFDFKVRRPNDRGLQIPKNPARRGLAQRHQTLARGNKSGHGLVQVRQHDRVLRDAQNRARGSKRDAVMQFGLEQRTPARAFTSSANRRPSFRLASRDSRAGFRALNSGSARSWSLPPSPAHECRL